MRPIVLATGNIHKVREIQPALNETGFQVYAQTEFFSEEVEEDGLSFVENAIKKARYACQKTGMPALADDSGLEVDVLGGQPGIYSARYALSTVGEKSDEQNLQKLLDDLQNIPDAQRQARYCCAMAYFEHPDDAMPIIGVGTWAGDILTERRTGQGIGYDDVFWVPQFFKTVSEIPDEIKNSVSHRAKALESVLSQLQGVQL
jgi:XTP/dITP diphosphohydrolase